VGLKVLIAVHSCKDCTFFEWISFPFTSTSSQPVMFGVPIPSWNTKQNKELWISCRLHVSSAYKLFQNCWPNWITQRIKAFLKRKYLLCQQYLRTSWRIFIHITRDESSVFHPSRKNGEVTRSHNHTISILSWQGGAQFGLKLKRSTCRKSRTFLSTSELLMCD